MFHWCWGGDSLRLQSMKERDLSWRHRPESDGLCDLWQLIDHDVFVVPRGALYLDAAHKVKQNKAYEGGSSRNIVIIIVSIIITTITVITINTLIVDDSFHEEVFLTFSGLSYERGEPQVVSALSQARIIFEFEYSSPRHHFAGSYQTDDDYDVFQV
jgi:hypothetical protein